jgi:membrane carboxypeptidase/penicillin-binding protein PbpC
VTVWVGNNDNTPMKNVASGISGASPIWRRIMDDLVKRGYKADPWEVPEGVEKVKVDAVSGYPEHDEFPAREEYVIKGTLPALPDPIHQKLRVCRGENKLATDARIVSGDFDTKEFIVLREEDPYSQDGSNRWQEGIGAWIASQPDEKYRPPTEYCGSSSDVSVRLGRPENEKTYDNEDIDIEVDADSGDGIEKIEVWIDGSLRETVNSKSYRGKVHMSAGQHEIFAKAKSRGGKEVTSGTVKIGTGGQSWKKPEPTPTPTPTPSPTATPTPTPSPSLPISPAPSPSP